MRAKYFLLIALVITFGHILHRTECDAKRSKSRRPEVTMENHWHVASIRLRPLDKPFGNGHICSGTLFAENKILSSADCLIQDTKKYSFFKPSKLRIVLGTIDRYIKLEETVVISNGIKYAYHPNYNIESGANDVAVIFFQQGILKNHPYIKPIPLIKDPPDEGVTCMVTSWPYDINLMHTPSNWVNSPMIVLARNMCAQTDVKGLICTQNNKITKDACSSELGEGLICNLSLAGIVAYDISCQWKSGKGRDKSYTVFTAVSYHSSWITNTEPMIYSKGVSLSNNQFLYLFGIILGVFLNYYL